MSNYNYKQYGDELRFEFCPICNEVKTNPDFTVNIKTGEYYCHSSGKGGNIKDLDNFDFDLNNITPNEKSEKKKKTVNFDELMKSRAGCHLGDDWLSYLKSRGISEKYLGQLCRLGRGNAMMMPITNGKHVVGIKYRTMDKKLTCESGTQSDYFLNWQNIKDESYLIIVEGEIDLLSSLEAGYLNTVSLPLGAKNTRCIDNQRGWIEKFSKIIIATDNDVAGKEAKQEIIKKLDLVRDKIYEINFGNFKDFNEILVAEGSEGLKIIIQSHTPIKQLYEPFEETRNGYWTTGDDGKRITDFTLKIQGYSDNYIKGTVEKNGRTREFKAKNTDLLTKNGILENLGYYLGSTQSIPKFWSWILDKCVEEYMLEIDHWGIIENVYYEPESRVICNKEDLKIQSLSEIGTLTDEDKEWLNKNLIYLRSNPNQSLLGICWALGRFHIIGSYPILEVSGTTSIGKTEYVEFISRILFGNKENIKSFTTLTNHQIRSLSSCSNITPWCIDEVKITGKNLRERAIELYSIIRSVYDNKTLNQGNITNKLTEFKLCTPLIISGETELSDVSIKNRMISTDLNKNNKSSDEVFFTFKKTNILEKFGKAALQKRLDSGAIDIPIEKVREVLKSVKDERQLYNGKCILTGLKALGKIIKLTEKTLNEFIDFLNRKLANEFNVVSNFKELMELVADSEREIKHFYAIKNGRHFVRFNLLYKAISEEHFKTNSTLELLDMRTLKKQLIEEGFIINTRVTTRFPKDEFNFETVPVKADEFIKTDIFSIKEEKEEDKK